MLVAGPDTHVFVFLPGMGNDGMGITVRRRGNDERWTHWRVTVMQRNGATSKKPLRVRRGERIAARRTLTVFEASRWQTDKGTTQRVGLKSYVRFKLSPGGRSLPSLPAEAS
jgi:hypothetical protein